MTGQELYELYVRKTLEVEGVGMDTWGELDEEQQLVWDEMALDINLLRPV